MPTITDLAAAQAYAEKAMRRAMTQDEGERFRQSIRAAYHRSAL